MEVKRWHTLAALVCSLSLQAVALAQKPEDRTMIGTLVTKDAPKLTDEKSPHKKSSDGEDQKLNPIQAQGQITGPDGLTHEATELKIQLPNGETGVIFVMGDASAAFEERVKADLENRTAPKFIIGVSLSEVPDSLRAHVTLPEGAGLMVGSLYPDSPAAKAGVMQYDLLLKCGEKDLKQSKDLQEIVDASEGKTISLTLQRKGEPKTIEVTPIKREDAKFALNDITQLDFPGAGFNGLRGFTFTQPEGQLPPLGFDFPTPVPMPPPMISPLESTKQMEALTDSIRQLSEQVERLKGSIDTLEKKQGEGEVDDKK